MSQRQCLSFTTKIPEVSLNFGRITRVLISAVIDPEFLPSQSAPRSAVGLRYYIWTTSSQGAWDTLKHTAHFHCDPCRNLASPHIKLVGFYWRTNWKDWSGDWDVRRWRMALFQNTSLQHANVVHPRRSEAQNENQLILYRRTTRFFTLGSN